MRSRCKKLPKSRCGLCCDLAKITQSKRFSHLHERRTLVLSCLRFFILDVRIFGGLSFIIERLLLPPRMWRWSKVGCRNMFRELRKLWQIWLNVFVMGIRMVPLSRPKARRLPTRKRRKLQRKKQLRDLWQSLIVLLLPHRLPPHLPRR